MKRLSLTEQFRTLEREVDAFIGEKTAEYKDVRQIWKRDWITGQHSSGAMPWDVEKVCFMLPNEYSRKRENERPVINKRAKQSDVEQLRWHFELLKKYGEVFFLTVQQDAQGRWTTHSSVWLKDIDDDHYGFSKEALAPAIERHNRIYEEQYAPREGCVPCSYCRKQVPLDKVVKSTLIYRSRDRYGKAYVAQEVRDYCSGQCAYNDQCAHEG